MNLMSFAFRTVRFNFFWNVHAVHYRLCIKETYAFLYFFAFVLKTLGFLARWLFWEWLQKFKLRPLPWRKLRLSGVAVCVLGCFFGLGFADCSSLRPFLGRVATFHVDSMLKLLSDMGATGFLSGRFGLAWGLRIPFRKA